MLLVQIVRIPTEGVSAFQRYESLVLPLLPRYGASLDRRFRSADGQFEVHVITFPSADALRRYKDDPERAGQLALLAESGASSELVEMTDVLPPD